MDSEHYYVNWHPEQPTEIEQSRNGLLSEAEMMNTPAVSEFIRVINKYPFSKSNKIGAFSFNAQDLDFLMAKIKICIESSVKLLDCAVCHETIKHAVVSSCSECKAEKFSCKLCWRPGCSKCKATSAGFQPVDKIVAAIDEYLKEIETNNFKERLAAIANVVKKCEMEIMCDYCFGHLQEAMLVKVNYNYDPERQASQCCNGCDVMYTDFYGKHAESIPLPIFDKIASQILTLLNILLNYCNDNNPTGRPPPNPYSDYPETSGHRKKGLDYLNRKAQGLEPPRPITNNIRSNDMASFKVNDPTIPLKTFLQFTKAPNLEGLRTKLTGFTTNEQLGPSAISGEDIVDIVIKIVDGNWNETLEKALQICLKWPEEYIFPILDLIRIGVLNSAFAKGVNQNWKISEDMFSNFSSGENPTNQMLMFKIICNVFGDLALTELLMENRSLIISKLLNDLVKDKKQNQIAASTVFLNYCVLVSGKSDLAINSDWVDVHIQTEILMMGISLSSLIEDQEAIYRMIVGIGTISHENQIIRDLFKDLNGEEILKKYTKSSKIPPKLSIVAAQVLESLGVEL